MEMSLHTGALAFAIFGTFFVAGLVKGVLGMGLPTVVMGFLGLAMPPAQAAALMVVPSLVTNFWQLWIGPSLGALIKRTGTMQLGVIIGILLTIGLLTSSVVTYALASLGFILALYGALGLATIKFVVPPRAERWLGPLIGLSSGAIAGATGVFVIPAVPYLNSLGLKRDELIQVLGLSFAVSTTTLAVALAFTGHFHLHTAGTSALALLPALAGMYLGQKLRYRLRPEVFRRTFFIGLIVLGLYIMFRALQSALR
jgi:uncharacterized protein